MSNERPSDEMIASTRRTISLLGGPRDGEQVDVFLGAQVFSQGCETGMHAWYMDRTHPNVFVYDGIVA